MIFSRFCLVSTMRNSVCSGFFIFFLYFFWSKIIIWNTNDMNRKIKLFSSSSSSSATTYNTHSHIYCHVGQYEKTITKEIVCRWRKWNFAVVFFISVFCRGWESVLIQVNADIVICMSLRLEFWLVNPGVGQQNCIFTRIYCISKNMMEISCHVRINRNP